MCIKDGVVASKTVSRKLGLLNHFAKITSTTEELSSSSLQEAPQVIMNKIITSCILLVSYIAVAAGDCYMSTGCQDGDTTHKHLDSWTPSDAPCATCYCFSETKYVLACHVEVPSPVLSVKKSALQAETTVASPAFEDIEILESEAATIVCPPVPGPTLNWFTGQIEEVKLKTVYYYYTRMISHCCNSQMYYRNVHPACKVVKTGQCTSDLVMIDDESRPCMMDSSMVG